MSKRETWIVAVSGGIDSAVLLDMLVASQTADLIVAHVDHGIRDDSHEDMALVRGLAEEYGLSFECTELHLGVRASEESARTKRYAWLDGLRVKHQASAVVTAHHQDDLLETIILNLRRGTGWRGICSLRETETRKRPMLILSKASIVSYAIERGLKWREDTTNEDLRYTRNYIRHGLMPRLTREARLSLIKLYNAQLALRSEIEREIEKLREMAEGERGVSRHWLIMLPDEVALELVRAISGGELLAQQARQLLLFAKTARPGTFCEAGGGVIARATPSSLILER